MGKDHGLDFAKPAKIGLNADALDRLGGALSREISEGRLPGAVALIAREGRVGYFEAFGKRDPGVGDEMQTDSIFRIYSMTKPIVSVAVMMLVEEGRLTLGDPLHKFIPAFADTKVARLQDGGYDLVAPDRPISIHDLLRHTSGLTYGHVSEGPVQRLYQEARVDRMDQTNAEQAETLAKLPLVCSPGAAWNYSRSTDILGRVVEVVAGRNLGEELHDRIFEPLGMVDTGFDAQGVRLSRVAEPFANDPESGAPVRMINVARPARFESGGGGLVSTAMDYARFCAMLAGGGLFGKTRIIGRKTLELMASDHLEANMSRDSNPDLLQAGHGFGLGFAVRTAIGAAPTAGSVGSFFWHGIGGTTFWIDPVEDLFAVFLTQAPGQRLFSRNLIRNLVYAAVE